MFVPLFVDPSSLDPKSRGDRTPKVVHNTQNHHPAPFTTVAHGTVGGSRTTSPPSRGPSLGAPRHGVLPKLTSETTSKRTPGPKGSTVCKSGASTSHKVGVRGNSPSSPAVSRAYVPVQAQVINATKVQNIEMAPPVKAPTLVSAETDIQAERLEMPLVPNDVIELEENSAIESSLSGYAKSNLDDPMVTASDVFGLVETKAPEMIMSEDMGVNYIVENVLSIDLSPLKPAMVALMENSSTYVEP